MTTEAGGFLDMNVTQEEYDVAGSKFITSQHDLIKENVNKFDYRDIEVTNVDWDNPGTSIKIEVIITEEGPDQNKEDKVSFGVGKTAIWKGKEIYRSLTGEDMPVNPATGRPAVNPMALVGKKGTGAWQITSGHKGGDPNAEIIIYPKLVNINPLGQRGQASSLGI